MTKKKYDYVIIGAGPAGLFASGFLAFAGKKVLVIDAGDTIENRKCPLDEKIEDTCKCRWCNKLYGFLGAGGRSDGKLLFHPNSGGDLYNLASKELVDKSIKKVEKLFTILSGTANKEHNENLKNEFREKCLQHGLEFMPYREKHIGSDNLVPTGNKLYNLLQEAGVDFWFHTILEKPTNFYEYVHTISNSNKKKSIRLDELSDKIVIAIGRAGQKEMQAFIDIGKVNYKPKPIDIGFRIETLNEITKPITDIQYDFKIYARFRDFLTRSYCVNPQGFVTPEHHSEFNLVNGHSKCYDKSNNCNFAILFKAELTCPASNSTAYAKNIAKVFYDLGDGKPIIQRLADIYDGRRSTENRIMRSNVVPTLSSAIPGDLTWAMPMTPMKAIIDYIQRLNNVMPGISNGYNTLLYGPEIKFQAMNLDLNNDFSSKINQNLYFIGDCSGKTGSIVSAAVMGIIFAMKQLK